MATRILTREEMETVIRCSAADKSWDIVTADPRIMRKLEKRGYEQLADSNPWGYVSYKIDFDRVKFGPSVKVKRPNAFGRAAKYDVSSDQKAKCGSE